MTIIVFLFILLVPFIPKIGKHIPAPLIIIVAATLINYYYLETKTVGDLGDVESSFPTLHIPIIKNFGISDFS